MKFSRREFIKHTAAVTAYASLPISIINCSNGSSAFPEKVELDLMQIIPRQDWYDFSNMLISHGRTVCNARKPNCPACSLRQHCPSAEKFMTKFWRE